MQTEFGGKIDDRALCVVIALCVPGVLALHVRIPLRDDLIEAFEVRFVFRGGFEALWINSC